MAETAIGIDLGTSNSCVAVARGSNVQVLPNAYGENTSASVVAFQADGSVLVGNAAKANIIHDPGHTVYSAKRLMGRYYFSDEVRKAQALFSYSIVEGPNHAVRIRVRDEELSLPEVSAMVLREMKSIAEASLGQDVTKAVVTVPAYFNDNQRQATRDAARIAGLDVLRLLNEPTAAALAYGFGRGLTQRVAVYDLGGGTFDMSVLEIGEDVFEVLSTCGDTFLGGDDFDDRLIDLLAEEFHTREQISLRSDPFALEKLKVAAEAAKKGLSVEDEVEIRIPDLANGADGQPRSIVRRVTSQEFAGLVSDLIQRTFKVCDEALQQAGVVARDLDGVILVGGPTRLPIIRQAVKEYFQQDPQFDVDPDEVVAMGAAIHAATLVDPQLESVLLDVTPLSLCIGVAGGLAEPVIERNTPVPIEQTRSFTTFQDHQESVRIRVYQGESRRAEENELLGQFSFSGFRRVPRGQVRIDVTFEIDSDGIVNVTACDQETGQQASTQITLSSGLSQGEIDRIIAEGRTDRVQQSGSPDSQPSDTENAEELVVPAFEETEEDLAEASDVPEVLLSEAAPDPPLGDLSMDDTDERESEDPGASRAEPSMGSAPQTPQPEAPLSEPDVAEPAAGEEIEFLIEDQGEIEQPSLEAPDSSAWIGEPEPDLPDLEIAPPDEPIEMDLLLENDDGLGEMDAPEEEADPDLHGGGSPPADEEPREREGTCKLDETVDDLASLLNDPGETD
jgi:molecular chaperone DnaK